MRAKFEAKRAMALTLSFDAFAAFVSMAIAVYWRWSATGGMPPNAIGYVFLVAAAFAGQARVITCATTEVAEIFNAY